MIDKLYIVAAGVSSRMGGMPKHLCEISNEFVLEHNIMLAEKIFTDIYVVLNEKLPQCYFKQTSDIVSKYSNVKIITISSGKGDMHAIYSALLKNNEHGNCVFCWGDTYFTSSYIFKYASKLDISSETVICPVVMYEKNPYCFYDVCGTAIVNSSFRDDIGSSDTRFGWHDQSLFSINTINFMNACEMYATYMENKIKDILNIVKCKITNIEYSLQKMIKWYSVNKNAINICEYIPNDKYDGAYSYNTFDELHDIENNLKNK